MAPLVELSEFISIKRKRRLFGLNAPLLLTFYDRLKASAFYLRQMARYFPIPRPDPAFIRALRRRVFRHRAAPIKNN